MEALAKQGWQLGLDPKLEAAHVMPMQKLDLFSVPIPTQVRDLGGEHSHRQHESIMVAVRTQERR